MTLKWLIKSEAYLRLCQASMNRAFRNSRRRCSVRKTVLRNFAKFTGKHLCQRVSFLMKLQASGLQLYEKRNSGKGVFLLILRISKNTFFTEQLWSTASVLSRCQSTFQTISSEISMTLQKNKIKIITSLKIITTYENKASI